MIGIYLIKSLIQNKVYIGKTKNFVKRRWTHLNELNKGIHKNYYLQKSWNKYGKDNFIFEFIKATNLENLCKEEIEFIIEYNSFIPNGFNLTKGGEGGTMPPEIIEKVRIKNLGKKRSQKTKDLISAGNKGRKRTIEQRLNLSKIFKGRKSHFATFNFTKAKDYIFVSPEKEIVKIHNLSNFCKSNNLNKGRMAQVYLGKEKQHKRWTKYES